MPVISDADGQASIHKGGNVSTPMRVAVYRRVSTDGQDADVQAQAIRDLVARRPGWTVTHDLQEVASGKARSTRPVFADLRRLVRGKAIDLVVVWKLDRIGRSTIELLGFLDELREAGVELVSATEAIDTTTPAGRVLFGVLAVLSEYERALMRERTLEGLRTARARGVKVGRRRVVVNLIVARTMLDQGYSLREIAMSMRVNRQTLATRLREAAAAKGDT